MKLFIIISCVCLVQICSAYQSYSEWNFNTPKIQNITLELDGINDNFEKSIFKILLRYPTDFYVNELIYVLIGELAEMSNSGNTRIDVDIVKKYSESTSKSKYYPLLVENVKVLQDILLRNLSPYDINGVINLMYAFRLNATTNEIQSALDYLYGSDNNAPFIKIPDQTILDCPYTNDLPTYKHAINDIKTIIDIKPKVIQDFIAIYEKFPCNVIIPSLLRGFIDMLIMYLKGNQSKIDVCTVIESDIAKHWNTDGAEEMHERVMAFELMGSILATRLPDENFHGIVDFIEAFRPDTTYYGIKRRLKYLYVHVPRPTKPCNGAHVPALKSTWFPSVILY